MPRLNYTATSCELLLRVCFVWIWVHHGKPWHSSHHKHHQWKCGISVTYRLLVTSEGGKLSGKTLSRKSPIRSSSVKAWLMGVRIRTQVFFNSPADAAAPLWTAFSHRPHSKRQTSTLKTNELGSHGTIIWWKMCLKLNIPKRNLPIQSLKPSQLNLWLSSLALSSSSCTVFI